jgi:Zn finger protein HypA/HybF involved in hydrogenase expression/hemerythrin-like domain-containing protein
MHELGLCEAVADAVVRRARGRPVAWARVRVGGHAVDPEVIAQGVAVAAAGTSAEGMDLQVVADPARARCRSCGAEAPVTDALALAACSRCGGIDVEVTGAEHAVLEAVGYRPAAPDVGRPEPEGPQAVGFSHEGGAMDAVEVLKHDHRMVEQLLRDYDAAHSDDQRRGVVEILIRELSKHAALEELTVYPFAQKYLGIEVDVDEQLAEHMALKKTLAALDQLRAGDDGERRLVESLAAEVTHHVEVEEGHFLPALRAAVDDQALADLGEQLEQAKKVAPTRPHPGAPNHPPVLTLAAPLVAVYDRLRDRLQGRPQT